MQAGPWNLSLVQVLEKSDVFSSKVNKHKTEVINQLDGYTIEMDAPCRIKLVENDMSDVLIIVRVEGWVNKFFGSHWLTKF